MSIRPRGVISGPAGAEQSDPKVMDVLAVLAAHAGEPVSRDQMFERDGDDLHCEVPVPLTTVAPGGKIKVPTQAVLDLVRVRHRYLGTL